MARAAPEFIHTFSPGLLTVAVLASLAWCAVLRWRTGRHRPAIWKSLVLPAAGTTLCWLLLMTLWLPLLNDGRSYAPLVQKIQALTGPATCLQYAGLSKAQGAAFLYHGRVQLQAASQPTPACTWLIADSGQLPRLAGQLQQLGWTESARVLRPTDNNETLVLFKPAQD